jgi:hypothetical protein
MSEDIYVDAARIIYYSSHGDFEAVKKIMAANTVERLNLIGKAGLEMGQIAGSGAVYV